MLRRGAKIAHDKYGKTPMNDAAENEQLEVRGKQMDSRENLIHVKAVQIKITPSLTSNASPYRLSDETIK